MIDANAFLGDVGHETPRLVQKLQPSCGATTPEAHFVREQLLALLKRKIRRGEFTLLVDALDQSNRAREPERCAQALADFLCTHATARCVVSGRPFAVQHYWKTLFAKSGPWELVQLGDFDKTQQEEFLGPERATKLSQLDADVLAIPRALETILALDLGELESVRTASDVYWRCVQRMLLKGKEDQRVQISMELAQKLLALLAFEMVRRGILDEFRGSLGRRKS